MGRRRLTAKPRKRKTTEPTETENEPCHVITPSTVNGGGSSPSPTRPCLLSELYSYQDLLSWQHRGKRNMMKALATTQLKAQATEDISTTEIHTSAPQVSELPSVHLSPLGLTKVLSPRVAMKGKFIESNRDTTIKDEEDPIETAQPLGIEKFIFECNQTLAEEELRCPTSLPPFAPNEVRTEPTPSHSLNLTEIAAMANDEADSKEVTSAFNPAFVTVGTYTVKKEFASVLKEILTNQGDIAEACSLRTNEMRSTFLEVICDGIQRLRELSFKKVRPEQLKLFLDQIGDLERVGIRVGWLREKVAEIDEVKAKFKESPSLKLAKTRSIEAIVKAETEMLLLEKKMNSLKEKIVELKAESERIDIIALNAKVTVNYFYNRRLLDSLA